MNEVLEDFKKLLLESATLAYIARAGGVIVVADKNSVPLQEKTPYLWLKSGGSAGILHLSSHRRWMPFNLEVHVCQRIFEKQAVVFGGEGEKGIEEIAKDVRFAMDMQRIQGKYARVFLTGEEAPTQLDEGNIHLLEKALTFEVVRVE